MITDTQEITKTKLSTLVISSQSNCMNVVITTKFCEHQNFLSFGSMDWHVYMEIDTVAHGKEFPEELENPMNPLQIIWSAVAAVIRKYRMSHSITNQSCYDHPTKMIA